MTVRIESAMEAAQKAIHELEDATKNVVEAIVAERCEPHPAQRQLAELEELTRKYIGKMHWIAGQLHAKGAHTFGAELRRAAHAFSAEKAAILGEKYEPTKHSVSVAETSTHGKTSFAVSCVCNWSAAGFKTKQQAMDYGNAHLRVAARDDKQHSNGTAHS